MVSSADRPGLLVLDMSYTLQAIRERGLEDSVTCRDLDGFFSHVWSVHPLASLTTSSAWASRLGQPDWHEISPRHTFIEGKIGRFRALRWLAPLNLFIAQASLFYSLFKLIRHHNIGVIRIGDPLYLGLFGLALARLAALPLLIRVNGNNEKVRQNTGRALYPRLFGWPSVERRIERFVFPRADLVAAPNQDNVDYSIASGARPERTTIFRYGNLLAAAHLSDPASRGCDEKLFARLGVEPGRYLLCVGRLMAVKFPEDALLILARLVGQGYDLKLVFAGDGPARQDLEALAKREKLSDKVVFAGNVDQFALSQLNPHAAAVISPLTGRALSESALGAASIAAYDLDWQGDLIETGVTGELVPFRDVDAFTVAVARLLDDRDRSRRLGQAARARALDILDPAKLDQHEREQYSKLLSR